MFILTNKADNVILDICKELDYMENGCPRDIDKDIAYPSNTTVVHKLDTIPEDVEERKYCYTPENGFYINKKFTSLIVNREEYNQLSANVDYLLLLNDAV